MPTQIASEAGNQTTSLFFPVPYFACTQICFSHNFLNALKDTYIFCNYVFIRIFTLTCPIGLAPHAPVVQKIADHHSEKIGTFFI